MRAGQLGGVWPGSGCRGCVTPARSPASCPQQINITTPLHCTLCDASTNTTAWDHCHPRSCCCSIKISVYKPLVLHTSLQDCGRLWLGWACPGWDIYRVDKRVLSIFNCLWRCPVLRLAALRLSCKPSTKFIYWHVLLCPVPSLQAGAGASGRWHLNMDILTVSHK